MHVFRESLVFCRVGAAEPAGVGSDRTTAVSVTLGLNINYGY